MTKTERFSVCTLDERKSPRYSTQWRAHVSWGDHVGIFPVVNASEEGLFVAMADSPAVSTHLVVVVEAGNSSIVVVGEVANRHIKRGGAAKPSGFGLAMLLKSDAWEGAVKGLTVGDTPSGAKTRSADRTLA